MASRTISSDRYGITNASVELRLARDAGGWRLNGAPMASAGEVIANIGIVMEALESALERGPESADQTNARELHARLYRLREVELREWSQIAAELEIPEPRLAKIRLAALELGLAVKDGANVRWVPPEDI